ncbi:porin family protein [Geomonas sp. Red32]|uniref:outer membrane beta-barrel protein n=1 Tax=Geomonas sp. Red32 TaxID=2912856 RepID=UPI00202CA957|nr:outer membrane beta-barrel protein [Geomonas sp. Red32]MCM0083584.1 porin family protein [Geomonas sp. Red32]
MRGTKKVIMVVMVGWVLASGQAFGKEGDTSVEASLNYGSESFDGLGGQIGVSVGGGYEFLNNLQGRVDLSYYRSSTDQGGMNVAGTRVPLDLGARYYFPLPSIDPKLAAFAQGGLEVSFDDWKPSADLPSRSSTRFGGVVGGGAEYMLDRQFGALVNLHYHIVEGGYLSTGIGMSYHF